MTNPLYLDKEEIISLVSLILEDTFENTQYKWHPEDAYCQIDVSLKAAFSALGNMVQMRKTL